MTCSLIPNEDRNWDYGFWPLIRVYCLVQHVSANTHTLSEQG